MMLRHLRLVRRRPILGLSSALDIKLGPIRPYLPRLLIPH